MLRRIWAAVIALGVFAGHAAAAPCPTAGPNLTLTNTTCQMSGVFTFTTISLTNSTIQVNNFDGTNHLTTGNLELRAQTITIDATSKITARGAGYQTRLCQNGQGPTMATGIGDSFTFAANIVTLTDAAGLFTAAHVGKTIVIAGASTAANNGTFVITAVPSATQVQYRHPGGVAQAFAGTWTIAGLGGRGGCSVFDSGGGGAHFGGGGRGTKDNPAAFPGGYEEDCSAPAAQGGNSEIASYDAAQFVATCTPGTACRNGDGLPSVAGTAYFHSIYQPEFGQSGGDKGCLDGDGRDPNAGGTATGLMVAGGGGGRIVLAAVNGGVGLVTINGTLDANGKRGCGIGNDSGGGGAGGTILVVGDNVTIGATALVTAAGGLGGDTQGLMTDPTGECTAPFQQNTQADDCGGGGGGGIISVLSGASANVNDRAVFSVNGAAGGVSTLCRGEAGGGVGELQISGGYVGEFCDGFDNDFDNLVDENLGTLNCGMMTVQACLNGVPQQCPPQVPACQGPVTDTRPRFTMIVDTSGSMLGTLPGIPTYGDGSVGHPGRDFDGNGVADDSRLFKAKAALNNVIAAYPDVDFALARYHQDQSIDRSCQLAHNFECNSICCTYDNPGNNSGPAPTPACTVNGGTGGNVAVLKDSPGDECINYAGNCGPPRRGADVLVGFGKDINQYLMWMDGTENTFNNSQTAGDYCNFNGGGDCELRGTGPTPLANSLNAVEDFLTPIKACDLASTGGCRNYSVILLTDGAESCQGDPVAAATALRGKGINTFVVGFSTLASETAQLNSVAASGGTGSAYLVGDENALANTLANIVSNSIIFETCNNLDDDCDTAIDEDFPGKGMACTNNKNGACFRQGTLVCSANGQGLVCSAPNVTCNASNRLVDQNGNDLGPCLEICNNLDDDCDGKVDEGLSGCTCVVQGAEQCDGEDDDCDGTVDENTDVPCGTGVCGGVRHCQFVAGCNPSTSCSGANCCYGACTATQPVPETCNGLDDDCDGNADGFTRACSNLNNGFPAFDPLNNPGANHMPDTGCETLNAAMPGKCKCQPGTRTCPLNGTGMFGACTGEVVPTTEICNGFDDDCDGLIDEAPPVTCTTNAQCAGSPMTPTCDNPSGMPNMGTCVAPDCSTNCGIGQLVCQNGMQVCNATTAPNDDTCDGNDDDCDGMIDEDWKCADPDGPDNIPGNADDCPCSIAGQCNAKESCQNGAVICQGTPTAQETCNCQDDNCNGQVDEGTLCPSGATCTSCQCAFHCSPGEFPCPLGKKCKGMAPNDFCVADPCFGVQCPAVPGIKQVCIEDPQQANNHLCVAACTQVSCSAGAVCIPQTGECKPDDCTTFPQRCSATQSCIVNGNGVGQCVDNPCAGVSCATGQYCVDNTCVSSCADVDCPTGQRCRLGTCEADPCKHPCPFGQACHDDTGQCVDDPCRFVTCPDGQWCNPNDNGACQPDPCKLFNVKCPGMGEVCRGGTCYDPASFQPDAGVEEVVTTGGGGGCTTTSGDAGLVVVVIALALMRRRRAAAGALALTAALLTTSCDVNKYCLNCAKLNGDGGPDDAVDAEIDAIDAPDASTCVPTGPEACNNKDDDCDGMIDEGTLAAPVGQLCTDIGGVTGPAVGECAGGINVCTNGAVVCSKPPTPEQCDGKDNDCNGLTDEGDPGGGAKCGTDVGECVAGTFHCNTTTHLVECQGAIGTVGGQTEVCNNRDDDCDGMFDEQIATTPCVPGVDGPIQGNTGECSLGTRSCIGGVTVCSGAVFPTFEQCDVADLDQDCDGLGHNGYDILNGDPQNCGACGTVCNLPHAFEGCMNGSCTIVACETGWHDNNLMASDGCESGFCIVTGNEICNGLDDDCSGIPDDNLGPPPNICKSGGECGTPAPTAMCMGALGWRCMYPGMVQTDPMTGAIINETRCDTKDNDCDGNIDEGQPNLGQPCTDSGVGVCQGKGSYQCDAMNLDNPAVCVITTPGASASQELCDDKDNNCDGIVDNTSGPNRVIDSMTHVVLNGLDYYIDTYEASRPDAATTNNSTSRACSTANRPPWRNVTWTSAQAACQAAGKVLCTGNQWQFACEGSTNTTYPYGNAFQPMACNTESFDGIAGGADDDVMINTGTLAACVSMPGVRDLSGNLKEWTDDITGVTMTGTNIAVLRGGSYETPKLGATCDFRTTRAAVNVIEASTGFRCCRATAP